VLMPSTDKKGGHIVCERLEKLFRVESDIYDKVSFKLFVYIGMATLPGDRSITSQKIMDDASQALIHARENRIDKTVIYSE
ncbi:MAG TPA: GGDEF domain-containing protein, partial [Anaerolineales bacterium]